MKPADFTIPGFTALHYVSAMKLPRGYFGYRHVTARRRDYSTVAETWSRLVSTS